VRETAFGHDKNNTDATGDCATKHCISFKGLELNKCLAELKVAGSDLLTCHYVRLKMSPCLRFLTQTKVRIYDVKVSASINAQQQGNEATQLERFHKHVLLNCR